MKLKNYTSVFKTFKTYIYTSIEAYFTHDKTLQIFKVPSDGTIMKIKEQSISIPQKVPWCPLGSQYPTPWRQPLFWFLTLGD